MNTLNELFENAQDQLYQRKEKISKATAQQIFELACDYWYDKGKTKEQIEKFIHAKEGNLKKLIKDGFNIYMTKNKNCNLTWVD